MWNAISKIFKDEGEEARANSLNELSQQIQEVIMENHAETERQMMAVDDMSELECLRLIAKAAVKYMRS